MILDDDGGSEDVTADNEPEAATEPVSAPADEALPPQLDKVAAAATTVPKPESRRERAARAQRETMEELSSLRSKVGEVEKVRASLEELQRANAALVDEVRRSSRVPAAPAMPGGGADDDFGDPRVALEVRAAQDKMQEHMAAGDWDGFMKAQARMMRAIAKSNAPQGGGGGGMPPEIGALRLQHHRVVEHPAGEHAYRMHEAMLPPSVKGIERVRKAFEGAEAALFGKPKPTVDKAARQALSAPSRSSAAPSGGKSIRLPDGLTMEKVREIARKARMTPEAYLGHYARLNPGDVVDSE